MVFGNGEPLRKNEKWYINGKPVQVTPYYKYLGLVFSSRMKWSEAVDTLASQARKAVGVIKTLYYKCGSLPIDIAFELFDKMVCSNSDIWSRNMGWCLSRQNRKCS